MSNFTKLVIKHKLTIAGVMAGTVTYIIISSAAIQEPVPLRLNP